MRQAAATAASIEPGPPEGNAAVLRLSGRLDVYSVARIWDAAVAALDRSIVQGMNEVFQQCLVDLERDLRAINLKA
jgi:hypothetical protein